jgi:hypothetical protein
MTAARTPIRVKKATFDALLDRMIKMPPLTLEDMKKEKAEKRELKSKRDRSARKLRG